MIDLIFLIIEVIVGLFELFSPDREQDQLVEKGGIFLFLFFFPVLYYLVGILAYELFEICLLGC